jgi:syntaxin 16
MQDADADRTLAQSTSLQTKQQRIRRDPNETMIAQREREIEDIAQGIIELANIFQELQTMVIDQGSMLDRIDYNVENMNRDVKEADKELKVASGYQQRSMKRKIMLLLAILIAGVFILLSLKLGTRSSSSPAPAAPAVPDEEPPMMALRSKRQPSASPTSRNWHRRKRRLWKGLAEDALVI